MLTVRHGVVLHRPCVRCMVTEEDNISTHMTHDKSFKEPKVVRRSNLEI